MFIITSHHSHYSGKYYFATPHPNRRLTRPMRTTAPAAPAGVTPVRLPASNRTTTTGARSLVSPNASHPPRSRVTLVQLPASKRTTCSDPHHGTRIADLQGVGVGPDVSLALTCNARPALGIQTYDARIRVSWCSLRPNSNPSESGPAIRSRPWCNARPAPGIQAYDGGRDSPPRPRPRLRLRLRLREDRLNTPGDDFPCHV